MAKAITGCMDGGGGGSEGDHYKGSIVITWPSAAPRKDGTGRLLAGGLTAVYDEETGRHLPVASVTVHVSWSGLITADLAVYLDEHGEIIYDLNEIGKSSAVPATFPFLVAEMRAERVQPS